MRSIVLLILLILVPGALGAQGWIEPLSGFTGGSGVVRVRTEVNARVRGRVALVEVDEWFENRGAGLGEGDYLYPLPGEAVFSNFSLFQGDQELRGETMDAGEARRIYEEIVRRKRDPALIELAGHGLLRARVFPINPGETRRITLRYTQLLSRAGEALHFRYAAGVRQGAAGPGLFDRVAVPRPAPGPGAGPGHEPSPLSFTLTVEEGARFRDPFSPTHTVRVIRGDGTITVRPTADIVGDFAVFLPLAEGAVGMTLVTHRPAGEDGYFMLTLSPGEARVGSAVPRDLTAVVDVSGSMSGGKLAQAQEALRQLLGTLSPRDRFRLVAFGSSVQTATEGWETVSPATLASARRWVDGLRADGGTNIAGALAEAFRMEPRSESLPIVVFLTDGLPSVGEQDPERLAQLAQRSGGRARVFSFGIGYDVNTHLLDRLSAAGRGSTEYVEPGESVEEALGLLADRIRHPVLTDLRIARQPVRLTEILPAPLPDLFAGEELVIFGRYAGGTEAEGTLEMNGVRNGRTERFALSASFPAHETSNDYVARLWGSRKLGELDRQIRLEGRQPELIEQARQLALRHGLLSAYSSYLVMEPTAAEFSSGPLSGSGSAGGRGSPPPPAATSGADAVRAANQASRQRAVSNAVELEAVAVRTEDASPDTREVGGRRFHRADGVWTDVSHRSDARLLRVEPFSPLYFELLQALPELQPIWSALDESVVAGDSVSIQVVVGGRVSMSLAERAGVVRSFRGS